MELLLNLVWLSLALGAGIAVLRSEAFGVVSRRKSLIALACVLLLLFPVVSASDDLHPAQALVEDASKRVQRAVAPLQLLAHGPTFGMLPALLAIYLLLTLSVWQRWAPLDMMADRADGHLLLREGRGPPSLS